MTKLSKNRFVIHRSDSSAMWSGAATITLDLSADGRLLRYAYNGLQLDAEALSSDYKKSLKRMRGGREREERLLAG